MQEGRRKDPSVNYSTLKGHVNPKRSIPHFLQKFPEIAKKNTIKTKQLNTYHII